MNKRFLYINLIFVIGSFHCASHTMNIPREECLEESFADKQMKDTLESGFSRAKLLEEGRKIVVVKGRLVWRPEKYLPLCLGGKKYQVFERAGSGAEGVVYEMVDDQGNKWALKVYRKGYAFAQKGDLLAQTVLEEAKKYMNVPVYVNTEHMYSIFPLLEWPYPHVYYDPRDRLSVEEVKKEEREFDRLRYALSAALKKDGLEIGDNLNDDNYMYDKYKDGRLWRIDFGSLQKIEDSSNEKTE